MVRSKLAASPTGRGLPESVALVGRENQSRLLRFTWNRLVHDADGGARPEEAVVVVRGVAGHREVGPGGRAGGPRTARRRRRVRGHCSPYHGNVALWPVGRMLEQLLGFYPDQPAEERLAELEQRLNDAGLASEHRALLTQVLGRGRRAVGTTGGGRPRTAPADPAGVRHLACPHRGVDTDLVVVEDLHWADPTTVELLGLLATERVPGTMILITSRDRVDTPWASSVVDIALEPLRRRRQPGWSPR